MINSSKKKMDKRDYGSVDIENLAASLGENIKTSHPLSEECCIYRVPKKVRCLNPTAYTPQVVSIGPLHHGKEELQAMEGHKMAYLHHFLDRTNREVSLNACLKLVKEKETTLRNCYAETVTLSSEQFVTMILVDAVFLIEMLLRTYSRGFITSDDHLFDKPWMGTLMWPDLWLLENQMPLFILKELFELAKDHYNGLTLSKLTRHFAMYVLQRLLLENNSIEFFFPDAAHFLDLLRLCLMPPSSVPQNILQTQNIPSATELHQAGVKFKAGPSKSLFDITFEQGVLEIPIFRITESTDYLFRNLQAFERLHYHTRYINDYVVLMNYLLNSSKDVELLVQRGVIDNWLWNCEAVSTLFENLVKGTTLYNHDFHYSYLVKDVKAYCSHPWHRWTALLLQDYFNSPWASISVIAAVILLILTVIQTACSISAL